MKVTKEMVHQDLKTLFYPLKIVAYLLTKKWGIKLMDLRTKLVKGKGINGLDCQEIFIHSNNNGPKIRVRIFKPLNQKEKLPVMLYCHGGGLVIGTPEEYRNYYESFIKKRPCIIVAPDYRKAVNDPYPAAFNDCYDTLLWIKDNIDKLGITKDKFIIAGHSAGGGLAAAVTLKIRDTKDVNVAFQMPIYPMIDDRAITESGRDMDVPLWNSDSNNFAWKLYLRDLSKSGAKIPSYAAPARNTNYRDLPPAITFVGGLEPFRDETINYVESLKRENIPVIFKFYKTCYHGFDIILGNKGVGKDALDFTYNSYAEFYDKYI